MPTKSALNAACLTFLPIFVLLSGYFLFSAQYLYSLVSLAGIVVCVRTRLFMGYRGTRGIVFRVHLACSGALLALLAALWLAPAYVWLAPLAYAAFISMVATGIALVKGSWHPLY